MSTMWWRKDFSTHFKTSVIANFSTLWKKKEYQYVFNWIVLKYIRTYLLRNWKNAYAYIFFLFSYSFLTLKKAHEPHSLREILELTQILQKKIKSRVKWEALSLISVFPALLNHYHPATSPREKLNYRSLLYTYLYDFIRA